MSSLEGSWEKPEEALNFIEKLDARPLWSAALLVVMRITPLLPREP